MKGMRKQSGLIYNLFWILLVLQVINFIQGVINTFGWRSGIYVGHLYPQIGFIYPGYIWILTWIPIAVLYIKTRKR